MEQYSSGSGKGFRSDGEGESQYLQRMGDVFLVHIGHGASLAKQMDACQTLPTVLPILEPILISKIQKCCDVSHRKRLCLSSDY